MIVDHGGATAVSERPAAGGVAWPAGLCSRSKNQQALRQGRVLTGSKLRHPAVATDLLRHNYGQPSTPYRATTKIDKTRSLRIKDPAPPYGDDRP
jgi:hypothetical protein